MTIKKTKLFLFHKKIGTLSLFFLVLRHLILTCGFGLTLVTHAKSFLFQKKCSLISYSTFSTAKRSRITFLLTCSQEGPPLKNNTNEINSNDIKFAWIHFTNLQWTLSYFDSKLFSLLPLGRFLLKPCLTGITEED